MGKSGASGRVVEGDVEQAGRETSNAFISGLATAFAGSGNGEWQALRAEGVKYFTELGIPTSKDEDWKYTSLQPLARSAFVPAAEPKKLPDEAWLTPYFVPVEGTQRLTFVDGYFAPSLSTFSAETSGLEISSLQDALNGGKLAAVVQQHLSRYASIEQQSFVALNTGLLRDGAVIHVKKGVVVEKPIQLLCVATGSRPNALSALRNLIIAEDSAQVRVIETYVALNEAIYLTLPVTEVFCGKESVVDHTKIQHESEQAFHIGSLAVRQLDKSRFSSHLFSFGGGLVRNEIQPVVDGEHIECLLNGLTVIGDEQHVDNFTVLDHAKPNSFSRELYKGIYAGRASGVFGGTIIVRPDAQKTNAIQSNQTLLLSSDATIDTRPQLKIYADDVKCTHGATVGQLDDEALFYLRSRGIELQDARNMLIRAFASDVIQYVPLAPLREQLQGWLMTRLDSLAAAS